MPIGQEQKERRVGWGNFCKFFSNCSQNVHFRSVWIDIWFRQDFAAFPYEYSTNRWQPLSNPFYIFFLPTLFKSLSQMSFVFTSSANSNPSAATFNIDGANRTVHAEGPIVTSDIPEEALVPRALHAPRTTARQEFPVTPQRSGSADPWRELGGAISSLVGHLPSRLSVSGRKWMLLEGTSGHLISLDYCICFSQHHYIQSLLKTTAVMPSVSR